MATGVVAYLRVSSKAQDLEMQRRAIERAAGARGDTVSQWFYEKGSAKTLGRPELNRLRSVARTGAVQKLYIFRLDRLTRSGIRDTFEVVEELRECGVEVISLADGFSLSGPAAEVIMAVLAWAAKMERLAINERISAARERVESEGRTWGRPSTVTDALRGEALKLRAEHVPVRMIARQLGLSKSAVARALGSSQKHEQATAAPGEGNSSISLDPSPERLDR